ncbi:MAG: NAD-dependent epimerase/dehydratase family protein [Candidatus Thermoplasmatota archaeon]
MKWRNVFVTGCAGFIGSHLCELLVSQGAGVNGCDDLSVGRKEYLSAVLDKPGFDFQRLEILEAKDLSEAMRGAEVVFHLAANPDVRQGEHDPWIHLEQNLLVTHRVLEAMRAAGVRRIVFPSTSTVYGDANVIPTPESYGPLKPISLYASSKSAAEATISAYCHTFDMSAVILRLANVVGPRSTHGVTYDFVQKLLKAPKELEVLGDGTQNKSYVHISDTLAGFIAAAERCRERVGIYNIGSSDQVDVRTIARIVMEEMGLSDVKIRYTGGVDGGRGWKGDVKVMLLSTRKLQRLGWRQQYSSADAVRATAKALSVYQSPNNLL